MKQYLSLLLILCTTSLWAEYTVTFESQQAYLDYLDTVFDAGRTVGRGDVMDNPGDYNLMAEHEYDQAYSDGHSEGYSDGQQYVLENPGIFSLYTASQFDANRDLGIQDVIGDPGAFDLYTASQLDAHRDLGRQDVLNEPSTYGFVLESSISEHVANATDQAFEPIADAIMMNEYSPLASGTLSDWLQTGEFVRLSSLQTALPASNAAQFEFDLTNIPENAKILSVSLTVGLQNTGLNNGVIDIRAGLAPDGVVDENDVFNDTRVKDFYESVPTPVVFTPSSDVNGLTQVDVSELVQLLPVGAPVRAVLTQKLDGAYFSFRDSSSFSGAYSPTLVIETLEGSTEVAVGANGSYRSGDGFNFNNQVDAWNTEDEKRWGILDFDLTSIDPSTITAATLNLYSGGGRPASPLVGVFITPDTAYNPENLSENEPIGEPVPSTPRLAMGSLSVSAGADGAHEFISSNLIDYIRTLQDSASSFAALTLQNLSKANISLLDLAGIDAPVYLTIRYFDSEGYYQDGYLDGIAQVATNPVEYNLFDESHILTERTNGLTIRIEEGSVNLALPLQTSSDLQTWEESGSLQMNLQLPEEHQQQFYRLLLKQPPTSN